MFPPGYPRQGHPGGGSSSRIMVIARLHFKLSPSAKTHENRGMDPKPLAYVQDTDSCIGVRVPRVALNGSIYPLKGLSAARTCDHVRLRLPSSMLVTRALCELPDSTSFNVNTKTTLYFPIGPKVYLSTPVNQIRFNSIRI